MNKESTKGTLDQKIAHKAKVWREHDLKAIGDKDNHRAQSAEWQARQDLRKTIDDEVKP